MLSQFFAGASAGVAVLLATHWLDTLKLLGQLGPINWNALLHNPAKLYMGIWPAVIETGAYNGINFGIYELVKLYYQRHTGSAVGTLVPNVTNLLMGLFSGVITQTVTSPLKVVAVRLGSGNTKDQSMAAAFRNVWREGGFGAFFRGNVAGLTSQPLTIALSFYFFERLRFYAEHVVGASPATTLVTGAARCSALLCMRPTSSTQFRQHAAPTLLCCMGASGGLAQDLTILLVYPVRSAKDKLQGQTDGEYSGLVDVWRTAYCRSGVRGTPFITHCHLHLSECKSDRAQKVAALG